MRGEPEYSSRPNFYLETMLSIMDHLNEISVEELQDALDNVDGNKPTQRLLDRIQKWCHANRTCQVVRYRTEIDL